MASYTKLVQEEAPVPYKGDDIKLPVDVKAIQKADVLQWFQKCTESDATWVLHRLSEISPYLFEAMRDKLPSKHNSRQEAVPSELSVRMKHHKPTGGCLEDAIIQFSSSIYYCQEGVDDFMLLDVMRIGNRDGRSEVFYATRDDSALAGRSYTATEGKLVFEPGEALLQIEVPIIDNVLWDTTTEFRCYLKQEGLQGAVLGQYLYQTRVKIIDNNFFPTDDFDHLTTPEDILQCSKWPLLFGYFRMIFNIPRVWRGTVQYLLVDVMHNLWYLFHFFLTVYLLDFVINTSHPESGLVLIHDRHKSLILCATITVFSVAFFHILDYARISFPIRGPARNFVQSALLRKFLNYKQTVREGLQPGNVMIGLEQNSVDLVNLGYFNMLKVMSSLGKMLCMLGFKLVSPLIFGGADDLQTFMLLFVIPILLLIFLGIRATTTRNTLRERNQRTADFTSQIESTIKNCHLVIDYSLRNHLEYKFLEKQRLFGAATLDTAQVVENNMQFCKWCEFLVVALWTLVGGLRVIDGSLTIGLFVTNLRLFEALGHSFLELYGILVKMMETFPALENVTTLMNHQTDVKQRCRLQIAQRDQAKRNRTALLDRIPNRHAAVVDIMPIVLNFQNVFKFEGKDGVLNFKGEVEIDQGQLVAFVGPLGCGKATLLRLIAGSVLPQDGGDSPIFVPSHLRVVNVAEEALFFAGTLYENMIFGLDATRADASRERVKSICMSLTNSHVITDYLDSGVEKTQPWQDVLSGAQCKLLSIARALIHNVEVVCIHKPLARLTNTDAARVTKSLHDHIDCKGLELTSDPSDRRPRTVIISAPAHSDVMGEADTVVSVDSVSGLKLI